MTLPVLLIGGPTASGKTAAAIAVAQRFGATVVSADAMQVYRGLDIGTAKATKEEQALARHEGIDVVDIHEDFDAAAFVALADAVIAEGAPVVVAGGTTLYIRSLLRGLVSTPTVDPALREELQQRDDWRDELVRVDPVLADRLHPNDKLRHIRGLEVFHQSSERLSELHDAHAAAPDRHASGGLWFDRDDLPERIGLRVQLMLEQGYVSEVRGVLDAGASRELKPLQSLGYRHMVAHLLDGLPLAEAAELTARDSRRFARKQRTWMRNLGLPCATEHHTEAALRAAEALWQP